MGARHWLNNYYLVVHIFHIFGCGGAPRPPTPSCIHVMLCARWTLDDVQPPCCQLSSITPRSSRIASLRDTKLCRMPGVFWEYHCLMLLHVPSKNARQFLRRQSLGVTWGTSGRGGRACIMMLCQHLNSMLASAHPPKCHFPSVLCIPFSGGRGHFISCDHFRSISK